MRISHSVFALGAVAFAGLLVAPAAAAQFGPLPRVPSMTQRPVAQGLMHRNVPAPPMAWQLPQGSLHGPPQQQLGPGSPPNHKEPLRLIYHTDFEFEEIYDYNQADTPSHKPWITIFGAYAIGDTVDAQHTLYFADLFADGVYTLKRGQGVFNYIYCGCEAFDVKVGRDGTVYVSTLSGDVIYEYANGAVTPTNTLYDANLTETTNMAVDGKGDVFISGPQRYTGVPEVDEFFAGSSKPKMLFTTPGDVEANIALDKYDNLWEAGFYAFEHGGVQKWAPPYTKGPSGGFPFDGYTNYLVMSNDKAQNVWVSGYDYSAPYYGCAAAYEFTQSGTVLDSTYPCWGYSAGGVAVDPPAPT